MPADLGNILLRVKAMRDKISKPDMPVSAENEDYYNPEKGIDDKYPPGSVLHNTVAGTGGGPTIGRETHSKSANVGDKALSKAKEYFPEYVKPNVDVYDPMQYMGTNRAAYGLGKWLGSLPEKGWYNATAGNWGRAVNANPFYAAGVGGLGGAALGSLIGAGHHLFSGNEGSLAEAAERGAVAGGLAGGGLSALISYIHNRHTGGGFKKMSFSMPEITGKEARSLIRKKLSEDSSLTFSQRNELNNMIERLTPQQSKDLWFSISSVLGAGIGAAVAKFLLNMGFTGTVLMALVGGVAGSMFGNREPKNMLGQTYLGNTDIFGRQREFFY